MIIICDRQHLGKPSNPGDHGATHGALRETDLTDAYIAIAAADLRAAGHTVYVLTTGEYGERQKQANAIAVAAPTERVYYVACHINAGGGSYGLVEYDGRSAGGARLAAGLALGLGQLPELSAHKTTALQNGERGWVCIAGIYTGPGNIAGAIYEPGFIDPAANAALWTADGLARVGHALASGLASLT